MLAHVIGWSPTAICSCQVACSLVECYHKCVNACDMNSLPPDMVASCADILKKVWEGNRRCGARALARTP